MRFPSFLFHNDCMLASPALGCECRSFNFRDIIQRPVIFIGEVIDGGLTSIRQDPWYADIREVQFRVIGSFRGLPKNATAFDPQT